MTAADFVILLAAYLVGSLPMGLFVGRLRGVDLREHGSRNIGATNAGRVLGRRWFFVVFVLDFAKSAVPVLLVRRFAPAGALAPDRLALLVGLAAVAGHVFSLFLRFKGGKGVATAAGLFAALAPIPALLALAAWLIVARTSGFVSLASLAAAVVLPLACWLLPQLPRIEGAPRLFEVEHGVRWAAVVVGALIVVRHHANIGRLLRGTEPRAGRQAS